MANYWYRVAVLGVEPAERRVRLRVWVEFYDTAGRYHDPLPDDASFFLRVLSENGDHPYGTPRHEQSPLAGAIPAEHIQDEDWVDANAWRFVERIEQLTTRNFPLTDEAFDRGVADGWSIDDMLVRADYDVWLTAERWVPRQPAGEWYTTSYQTRADRLRAEDLPYVPDLRAPVAVLTPFAGAGLRPLSRPAFSDDSRYLAASSTWTEREAVVYRSADWTPARRFMLQGSGDPLWATGGSGFVDGDWVFDVDTGRVVTALPEPGWIRSSTGRYRVEYGGDEHEGTVVFLAPDATVTRRLPVAEVGHGHGAANIVGGASFTADEARMFVAVGDAVKVLELPSGRIIDTVSTELGGAWCTAVHPGGAYLAVSWNKQPQRGIAIVRLADHEVVTWRAIDTHSAPDLAWSPDGRWLAATVNNVRTEDEQLHVFPVHPPPPR